MVKRFNQSDPTANAAIGNVMKSGKGRIPLTLRVQHDRVDGEDVCYLRGPGVETLLPRTHGDVTAWSGKLQAFVVTPAVARAVVAAAERRGYGIAVTGKAA